LFLSTSISDFKSASRISFQHMPFYSVIKDAASPSQHIISDCRRTTLDDFLQHVINMEGTNIFNSECHIRVDVFVDATAQNVWMLPAGQDLAFKVFGG
jgi:hypothetical protein